MKHERILTAIQAEMWAITPEGLQTVVDIAQGLGDPEAVAARLGKPLTNTRTVTVRDGVAVVPVTGPIFRYANLFTEISGATSIQTLATDLQAAVDDPAIKAIILEIDSPGGQVSGVSEFAAQVRAAAAIKPVVSYISNLGASAAYWIASAASSMVASDTALIGSVGAVWQTSIEKENGTVKFISSQSPLKQASPATDAGRMQYQKTVDALAEVFINAVADYRGTTRESVIANFGQGGIMIAADAIAAGMVDRLGSLESLIAQLSGDKTLSTSKRGTTMSEITREMIASDYPDIAKAFVEEGHAAGLAEGKKQGAEAERNRIKDIEALALPGHEALIAQLKFDGETTAAEAAIQVLNAEKTTRNSMAGKIERDTPKPVAHAVAAFHEGAEADEGGQLTGQEKWEHEWRHSAALQKEFTSMAAYVAYQKNASTGKVKILGAKR